MNKLVVNEEISGISVELNADVHEDGEEKPVHPKCVCPPPKIIPPVESKPFKSLADGLMRNGLVTEHHQVFRGATPLTPFTIGFRRRSREGKLNPSEDGLLRQYHKHLVATLAFGLRLRQGG
jgi:hypothetical protein